MGHTGNPAPFGLMAFALCIFMLGALNAGLVDSRFKELLTTFGFWWAGLGQIATGLFELLHGNSFGALIFWTYGSLWLSLSSCWFYTRQNEYNKMTFANMVAQSSDHRMLSESALTEVAEVFGYVGAHHYKAGESMMLALFALATLFFFVVSLRRNRALQTCLFILFWSLSFGAIGEFVEVCKVIGGVLGMMTGFSAFYIMAAEIVNEEWGYALMPGLASCAPAMKDDGFASVFNFDKAANSVFLNLGGYHFMSEDAVDKFETFLDGKFSEIGQRVHVVVNYKGVEIAPGVQERYSMAIRRLQTKHYLSVKRFAASAFRDAPSSTDAGVFTGAALVGMDQKANAYADQKANA